MNKLYELSWIKDPESLARPIAYSHDTEKLTRLAPWVTEWHLSASPKHTGTHMHTSPDVFPRYKISEVPFVI